MRLYVDGAPAAEHHGTQHFGLVCRADGRHPAQAGEQPPCGSDEKNQQKGQRERH